MKVVVRGWWGVIVIGRAVVSLDSRADLGLWIWGPVAVRRCQWEQVLVAAPAAAAVGGTAVPAYLPTTLLGRNLGTCHGEEGARERRVPR